VFRYDMHTGKKKEKKKREKEGGKAPVRAIHIHSYLYAHPTRGEKKKQYCPSSFFLEAGRKKKKKRLPNHLRCALCSLTHPLPLLPLLSQKKGGEGEKKKRKGRKEKAPHARRPPPIHLLGFSSLGKGKKKKRKEKKGKGEGRGKRSRGSIGFPVLSPST